MGKLLNKNLTVVASATSYRGSFLNVQVGGETLVLARMNPAQALSRFNWLIKKVFQEFDQRQCSVSSVISTLICFDGLTNRHDLTNVLKHLHDRKLDPDGINVTWIDRTVVHRRYISVFTAICANQIAEWPANWDLEVVRYFEILKEAYPVGHSVGRRDFVGSVFCDAQVWLQLHLPAPCFAYLCGTLPLTLLPQEVLDRRIGVLPKLIYSPFPESEVLNTARDIGVDYAFGVTFKGVVSKVVVHALKNLFNDGVDDSIRSADFLERRATHISLQQISSTLLKTGCPINATLLLWVIHLIEFGSVRRARPTVGTIKRYVYSAVEDLHQALHQIGKAPIDFNDEDWEQFFSSLTATCASSVQLNALASFHRFAVVQFGIEPMADLFSGASEVSVVAANVVWDHELERAFKLVPEVTTDLRMRRQMRAMLAIAASDFVRIGDLPSVRMSCIQKVVGTNLLGICIYPSRGDHQGKSEAARKTLDFTNSRYREFIQAWIDLRNADAAEPNERLFGDPNFPDRCYKFGQCQRLINQILKQATGDPGVSFHTLRHTRACVELKDALLNADIPESVSTVHKVAVRAAHKSERTTFSSYFHAPERPIRHWIDKALDEYFQSPSAIGPWLNEKPNSLVVSRKRSNNPATYLKDRLEAMAGAGLERYVLPVSSSPIVGQDEVEDSVISFSSCFNILRGIYSAKKLSVVASNNNTVTPQVIAICRSVIAHAHQLENLKDSEILAEGANDLTVLNLASKLIKRMHCHFSSKEEGVLCAAKIFFGGVVEVSQEVRDCVKAWVRCKRGAAISSVVPDRVRVLMSMLFSAGIPASSFILRVAVADPQAVGITQILLARADVLAALSVFEALANTTVQLEAVCFAKGRPHVYFMLARKRLKDGQVGASAKCRMNRLHALLLALAVWCSISNKKEE